MNETINKLIALYHKFSGPLARMLNFYQGKAANEGFLLFAGFHGVSPGGTRDFRGWYPDYKEAYKACETMLGDGMPPYDWANVLDLSNNTEVIYKQLARSEHEALFDLRPRGGTDDVTPPSDQSQFGGWLARGEVGGHQSGIEPHPDDKGHGWLRKDKFGGMEITDVKACMTYKEPLEDQRVVVTPTSEPKPKAMDAPVTRGEPIPDPSLGS